MTKSADIYIPCLGRRVRETTITTTTITTEGRSTSTSTNTKVETEYLSSASGGSPAAGRSINLLSYAGRGVSL